MGCAISLIIFGLMFIPFIATSGIYSVLAVIFVGVGIACFVVARAERHSASSQEDVRKPEDGFRTFDPETGEEIRIANGRRYRKVKGKWKEIKEDKNA